MLLRFLHFIGLTNLSESDVEKYYLNHEGNAINTSKFLIPYLPHDSLYNTSTHDSELSAILDKVLHRRANEYKMLTKLPLNAIDERNIAELTKVKAESELFHIFFISYELKNKHISSISNQIFKSYMLLDKGELGSDEFFSIIKSKQSLIDLELKKEDINKRKQTSELIEKISEWIIKYDELLHNKSLNKDASR